MAAVADINFTIVGEIPRAQLTVNKTMPIVAELMGRSIDRNFEAGGRPTWIQRRSDSTGDPLRATGALRRSKETFSGNNFASVSVGKNLPYARIQREGGTITVPVTKKMRGFFWAKWFETGETKWRNMALTTRSVFVIHIPAREYMNIPPEELREILEVIGEGMITFQFTNSRYTTNSTINWS
jgi:phage gpG-like protein